MKLYFYKIFKILPIWLRWFIVYIVSHKFLVGVTAFVVKKNQILLLKNTYQYYWALPGGYLKKDESFQESIEREILEETGLKVKMDRILKVKTVQNKPVLNIILICHVMKGILKVDQKEVQEARFFDLNNLPDLDSMPIFQRDYIELFKSTLKK